MVQHCKNQLLLEAIVALKEIGSFYCHQ